MFERPEGGERAVLVHVDLADSTAADLEEFADLARASGAEIVGWLRSVRSKPDPRLFIGRGKSAALRELVVERRAELVLFDHDLSPAQERNLERVLEARVLARTGLILDIFAQRARTHEGKLQVELAQLEHASTRLVRGWTHLDRQAGGIGGRGVGETQLELDQRLIRSRIAYIEKRLARVRSQRSQNRRARRRAELPLVALVGYTNTGKSTLFNVLADARVRTADQLFATLDPTLRRLTVPGLGPVVLADTVGFVGRLPHKLVEAFKATLEEVAEADLLLHVLDANDPALEAKRDQVEAVLAEIGVGAIPRVELVNKIDRSSEPWPRIQAGHDDQPPRVWLSAREHQGLEMVGEMLARELGSAVRARVHLRPEQGRLRSQLYDKGWVERERVDDSGALTFELRLPSAELDRLASAGALVERPAEGAETEDIPAERALERVAAPRTGF